jgi:hypothetical protein
MILRAVFLMLLDFYLRGQTPRFLELKNRETCSHTLLKKRPKTSEEFTSSSSEQAANFIEMLAWYVLDVPKLTRARFIIM